MKVYRDHALRLAMKVSIDLSKRLAAESMDQTVEDGFLVGQVFAAVLDGVDFYWAKREHQAHEAAAAAKEGAA